MLAEKHRALLQRLDYLADGLESRNCTLDSQTVREAAKELRLLPGPRRAGEHSTTRREGGTPESVRSHRVERGQVNTDHDPDPKLAPGPLVRLGGDLPGVDWVRVDRWLDSDTKEA